MQENALMCMGCSNAWSAGVVLSLGAGAAGAAGARRHGPEADRLISELAAQTANRGHAEAVVERPLTTRVRAFLPIESNGL